MLPSISYATLYMVLVQVGTRYFKLDNVKSLVFLWHRYLFSDIRKRECVRIQIE
jgi:hypothetical protein